MILKGKIYLLLTILLLASCTVRDPSYQTQGTTVVVGSGDTIYSIARRYDITVRDLAQANNLQAPYLVQVGKRLTIPRIKYHIVRPGDNLYQISRLYNIKVARLIELNSLSKPYNISVGSSLMVSNSTFSTPAKTAVNKVTKTANNSIDPSNKREEVAPSTDHNFIWPVKGTIVSNFGQKSGGLYNDGINIKAPAATPVKAAEDGVVAYVGNELRGYGNLIIIKHSDGWISAYAHLSKSSVKIGDEIKQGAEIGNVGATGNVDFSQLYFGIRKGKNAVNPTKYLK